MKASSILTSYFTTKPDPQRNEYSSKDDFSKMINWYFSIVSNRLNAVVFYDDLSPTFIRKYERENILFEHYSIGKYSINDERFFCYLDYIISRPNLSRLFMTDLFDVDFLGDPFSLFDDEKFDLYIGTEDSLPGTWLKYKYMQSYGRLHYTDKPVLNAGIIGGNRQPIVKLLSRMVDDFRRINSCKNVNMAVFNKCVYDLFDEKRILKGYPLHSRFKRYEKTGPFYIRHK